MDIAVCRRPNGVRLARIRPRNSVVLISRGALTKLLHDALSDGVVETGVEVSDVDNLTAVLVAKFSAVVPSSV
ncbi:hypothetical protein LWC34_10850 [Kibdelosporangium philippinense]|uniref:Uncharacterized protein n=1 Tax=Kibdelosporangium philippinense TaxID=211113 RepID=A0ABS8Z614_9PSEU|nr:hypothetical protein [Kibdelosporangium philippinense]MCE7003321.1 hypothetical protein [Kibdelosporangium philippinense]